MNDSPLVYLAGDIMSRGSQLARQEEYDDFLARKIPVQVYSPVMNKSINDKSAVSEKENNHLAEKITAADIERMWKSADVVIAPEQFAIGTMCELGCLYGWKYMAEQLLPLAQPGTPIFSALKAIQDKEIYPHYEDLRDTKLNEKGWRRSFSINQLLYGMCLYLTGGKGFSSLSEIMDSLEKKYKETTPNE